ncbi:uncharacterized protein LOC143025305 [Oratosquilla oratoria]|uniref:uncharacterized protein LOC143025305 n=1 Tax=Oratosquilla oratoria TaxID=337810 RepID=UPI003F75C923
MSSSASAFTLSRPVYSLHNELHLPVPEGKSHTTGERVKSIVAFSFPFTILLDALAAEIGVGRSLGDDQVAVYSELAAQLTNAFGVDGRSCLLRFVCEMQRRALAEWTIVGELLTVLFNPSKGGEGFLDDFRVAKKLGKADCVLCSDHYTECPISVFNYFESLSNATLPQVVTE